jgi:hypothetical protein
MQLTLPFTDLIADCNDVFWLYPDDNVMAVCARVVDAEMTKRLKFERKLEASEE